VYHIQGVTELLFIMYRVSQNFCVSYTGCHRTAVYHIQGVTELLCIMCRVSQNCCVSCAECHKTAVYHVQGVTELLCIMYRVSQNCCVSCTGCPRTIVYHVQGVTELLCIMYRVSQNCCVSYECKPRLKSPKNKFQLSAGLNLYLKFDTFLVEQTIFEPWLKFKQQLKFFKFGLRPANFRSEYILNPDRLISREINNMRKTSII